MATAPNTLVMTGPNFEQDDIGDSLITPTGGSRGYLKDFLNGGTTSQTVVNLTVTGLERFSATNAIATAGSTQATGTALTTMIGNVTTSTAGQVANLLAAAPGSFEVIVNNGTADFIGMAAQGARTR